METLGLIAGVRLEGNQNHVLDSSWWWDSRPAVLANLFQCLCPVGVLEYFNPIEVASVGPCHIVKGILKITALRITVRVLEFQNLGAI